MISFIKKAVLFALIQCVIAGYLLGKYPADRGTYLSATIDKHALLERQISPRLIVVGGSNVAFGFDSEMAQNATGYHPVNMGLHAALGIQFQINEIENDLRPGDFVILAPELDNFAGMGPLTFFYERAMEQRFANAQYIPWEDLPASLDHGLPFLLELVGNVKHPPLETIACTGRPYCRSGFNTYGDEFAHWALPGNPEQVTKSLQGKFTPDEAKAVVQTQRINAFARRCEKRGVGVVFSYAPMPESRLAEYREPMQQTVNAIETHLEIPCLYKLEEVCFPIDHIWDSLYHMNRTGVTRRTQLVIERIQPILAKRRVAL